MKNVAQRAHLDWTSLVNFLGLLFTLAISPVSSLGAENDSDPGYGKFGTRDFVQYWSATKLAIRGDNPYSPEKLLEIEQTTGFTNEIPLMMWVPPWSMLLLYPITSFPFEVASQLWIAANLILITSSLILLTAARGVPRRSFAIQSLLGVSFPLFQLLETGQISGLILFFISLSLLLYQRGFLFLSGLILTLSSIKPHLSYLLVIGMIWTNLLDRNYRFIFGLAIGALLLGQTTEAIFPGTLLNWFEALTVPPPGAIAPNKWLVASLPGFFNWTLPEELLRFAPPSILIPIISAALTLSILRNKRLRGEPSVQNWLILASIITSPYCWTFDFVLLLPVVLIIVGMGGPQGFIWLICINALAFIQLKLLGGFHHEFFWVPICLAVVALMTSRGNYYRHVPPD